MSSPTPSDISQNDAEVLEKQWQEMQQRHKEEQQLLIQLEEVVKLHQAECAAEKARRKVEAKAKKEGYRGGGEEKENNGVPPAPRPGVTEGRGCLIGEG